MNLIQQGELLFSDIEKMVNKVSSTTERSVKEELGQFLTHPDIAKLMVGMFDESDDTVINILDPGAGTGVLSTSLVHKLCNQKRKPVEINLTVVELDNKIIPFLKQSLEMCSDFCSLFDIKFNYEIIEDDFVRYFSIMIEENNYKPFNRVIMNPPYKKFDSGSPTRKTLSRIGIEISNLYAAFVWLGKKLLDDDGQLVAITPRSFCNGSYFKGFRVDFISDMTFKKIHLFESRTNAFSNDDVLQENIIFHATKNVEANNYKVQISSSYGYGEKSTTYLVDAEQIISPDDPEKFIRILKDDIDITINGSVGKMSSSLKELNLEVSTGKVVSFRSRENLIKYPQANTAPLIYPLHFKNGSIYYPVESSKKHNAILINENTRKSLVPKGNYLLLRRKTSKEEKKRIVTAIYDSDKIHADLIGFDNDLNYFHINGEGLPMELAKGLCVFLNSTFVDRYFRQFNGHTQVNATDLRNMPYPSYEELLKMGEIMTDELPVQKKIDDIVLRVLNIDITV